jgi:O-antigen ligase
MKVHIVLDRVPRGQKIQTSTTAPPGGWLPRPAPPPEPPMRWTVVWEVILCGAPAAFLIYLAQLRWAAVIFCSLLGLLVFYHSVRHEIIQMSALVVGCIPMLMLLRPVFYQNSISVILAFALLMWSIWHPAEFLRLFRDPLIAVFCLVAFCYWWYSFLVTGIYSTNLRIFELALGGSVVGLLGMFRVYLAGAIWGLGASTALVAAAIWQYGIDRLGSAMVANHRLGNPEQTGLGCTLILILCVVDQGRWLRVGRGVILRIAAAAAAAALLILSTSRTSWVVALVGLASLMFARGQRRHLVLAVALFMLVVAGVLASSRGETVRKYFDKVVSEKRTLSQKTSGRYDMYVAFPELFWQSPVWGHGPGAAETLYRDTSHKEMAMHSLVLHLGIELGVFGLAFVLFSYSAVIRRAWRFRKLTGEIAPLACAMCCCVDALAHNSFNPLTATFLGLALSTWSFRRIYRVVPAAPWLGSNGSPRVCTLEYTRER